MDAATSFALTSLVVSFAAGGFSLWSAITAHRAHSLTVAQSQERDAPLKVYLADGYVERIPKNDRRRFAFLLSVTNSATLENSIASLELRIHYRDPANHLAMIDLGPDDVVAVAQMRGSKPRLVPPIRLSPREAVSGWIAYEAPGLIFQGHHVDVYEVRVTDASGRIATWKTVHVKEVTPSEA